MSKAKRRPDLPGRESVTRREAAPLQTVSIECPLGEVPEHCYLQRHVEVQLSHAQATTLKRLVEGLDLSGARLGNQRRITTGPDALRYVLEQMAVSHETAP